MFATCRGIVRNDAGNEQHLHKLPFDNLASQSFKAMLKAVDLSIECKFPSFPSDSDHVKKGSPPSS